MSMEITITSKKLRKICHEFFVLGLQEGRETNFNEMFDEEILKLK